MFDKDNKFGFINNNENSNNNIEGLDNIKTDVNNIKTDLGDEELTTVNKNVKGAINEVNAQYKDIANNKADKVTTDNIQQQVNNLVLGKSETDENIKAEVQQARGNNGLLNERLNSIEDTIGSLSKGDDTKTYLNFKWEIGALMVRLVSQQKLLIE